MVIVGRGRHFPGRSVMVIVESIIQTKVEVIRVPTGCGDGRIDATTTKPSNGSRLGTTGPLLELFIQCLDALVQ